MPFQILLHQIKAHQSLTFLKRGLRRSCLRSRLHKRRWKKMKPKERQSTEYLHLKKQLIPQGARRSNPWSLDQFSPRPLLTLEPRPILDVEWRPTSEDDSTLILLRESTPQEELVLPHAFHQVQSNCKKKMHLSLTSALSATSTILLLDTAKSTETQLVLP